MGFEVAITQRSQHFDDFVKTKSNESSFAIYLLIVCSKKKKINISKLFSNDFGGHFSSVFRLRFLQLQLNFTVQFQSGFTDIAAAHFFFYHITRKSILSSFEGIFHSLKRCFSGYFQSANTAWSYRLNKRNRMETDRLID